MGWLFFWIVIAIVVAWLFGKAFRSSKVIPQDERCDHCVSLYCTDCVWRDF